jgi:hypothetical protein
VVGAAKVIVPGARENGHHLFDKGRCHGAAVLLGHVARDNLPAKRRVVERDKRRHALETNFENGRENHHHSRSRFLNAAAGVGEVGAQKQAVHHFGHCDAAERPARREKQAVHHNSPLGVQSGRHLAGFVDVVLFAGIA